MEERSTSAKVVRRSALVAMVDALGDWSVGPGSLHRKLARVLAGAIERGELATGDRLPSDRSLAEALAVSRGVVVAAYDELVAGGLAERHRGSGTFVAGDPLSAPPPGREGTSLFRRLTERAGDQVSIDLSISSLADAPGLPSVAVSTSALASAGSDDPWGLPELRTRIAERLTGIGLPSTPGQVVVTTGAQQGISVAAGCWVRPGDRVVVDDPTYPGALAALQAAGAVVVPVSVDRHGPVLAELQAALAERPALVYVQSGVHSPTGGRLSEHRRRTIAELVVSHRVPLVEDHALFALDWSAAAERPPAPVASWAPDHPIAVVGSYSKRFWAGLRVGFVRAPEPVAQRLVRVKATHDLGSSVVGQSVALHLLDHRGHVRFVERRNATLARRAQLLLDLLADRLPTWRCSLPDGGLSLWVRLPEPVAARFADQARRHGVVVATAEGLSARPNDHRDRLRLTFARSEPELRTAVVRLAEAWAELG